MPLVSYSPYTTPGTHVDNDPGHTLVHNQLLAAAQPTIKVNVLDAAYGADPTGQQESTQAFINAIAALPAGGGIVYAPAGTYLCNAGAIPVATGLKLLGDGYGSTKIVTTFTGAGGYLFNLDPFGYSTTTHVQGMWISGFTFDVTNADIFWGANLARCHIVDNQFLLRSTGKSVMNVSQATGTNGVTYLAENEFANVEFINGAVRTVPAWNLDFTGTGLRCNDNVWWGRRGYKIWSSNGGDTTQYWMQIKGDAAGAYGSKNNTFRDLIFELPNGTGGLIHLMQMEIVNFENVTSEDLSGGTVGNPLILLNTISGGAQGCRAVTINSYSRRSGTNISNTVPDIKLDANCDQVVIRDPKQASGGSTLIFDTALATNVTIQNPPPTYAALNPSSTFHATPTEPAGFAPANPAATASTTLVMMGLAMAYTPSGTGKVLVNVAGTANTATGSVAFTLGGRRGTGTAPVNGAAVTGSRFGGTTDQTLRPAGTSGDIGFSLTALVSLTKDTTYWFDLALSTTNAADAASVSSVSVTLVEQP